METDLAYCVYLIWQCSVVFTLLSQCSSTIVYSLAPRPIRKKKFKRAWVRGYIVSFPVYCSHCCLGLWNKTNMRKMGVKFRYMSQCIKFKGGHSY